MTLVNILRNYLGSLYNFVSKSEIIKRLPDHILEKIIVLLNKEIISKYDIYYQVQNKYPCFVFVIPSRNNEEWVDRNLTSVFQQKYPYYRVIYIDDCSTDKTLDKVMYCTHRYNKLDQLKLIKQPERNMQSCSRFIAYHHTDDDEILCMLDGDDWLYDQNTLLKLSAAYMNGAMVTYGSYYRYDNGKIQNFLYGKNEKFTRNELKSRNFRLINWKSQHLRTGYAGLFKRIRYLDLVDRDNNFFQVCTDLAEMIPVLEMASPNIYGIDYPLYVYNIEASKRNKNSYFRINQDSKVDERRQKILNKIKSSTKYPSVSIHNILLTKNILPDLSWTSTSSKDTKYYINNPNNEYEDVLLLLVKIIEACGLPFLGKDLNLSHKKTIFIEGIETGIINSKNNTSFYIINNSFKSNYLQNNIVLNIISKTFDPNILLNYF